jgi:ribosomal protein L37AE/L43A
VPIATITAQLELHHSQYVPTWRALLALYKDNQLEELPAPRAPHGMVVVGDAEFDRELAYIQRCRQTTSMVDDARLSKLQCTTCQGAFTRREKTNVAICQLCSRWMCCVCAKDIEGYSHFNRDGTDPASSPVL